MLCQGIKSESNKLSSSSGSWNALSNMIIIILQCSLFAYCVFRFEIPSNDIHFCLRYRFVSSAQCLTWTDALPKVSAKLFKLWYFFNDTCFIVKKFEGFFQLMRMFQLMIILMRMFPIDESFYPRFFNLILHFHSQS